MKYYIRGVTNSSELLTIVDQLGIIAAFNPRSEFSYQVMIEEGGRQEIICLLPASRLAVNRKTLGII